MTEPVDQILLRFPGPVKLKPRRVTWVLALVFSLICVGAIIFVGAVDYALPDSRLTGWDRIILWACFILFGGAAVRSATALRPGGADLILDRIGFEYFRFFRTRRVLWDDASNFTDRHSVWSGLLEVVSGGILITVAFENAKKKSGLVSWIKSRIFNRNDYLPHTYGLWDHDLARLMNEWRELALK